MRTERFDDCSERIQWYRSGRRCALRRSSRPAQEVQKYDSPDEAIPHTLTPCKWAIINHKM
jgi:hypothetical protein